MLLIWAQTSWRVPGGAQSDHMGGVIAPGPLGSILFVFGGQRQGVPVLIHSHMGCGCIHRETPYPLPLALAR